METYGIAPGVRVAFHTSRPWHRGTEHGVHAYWQAGTVTGLDDVGFDVDLDDVTEETGRPPFAKYPEHITMAWFAVPHRLATGELRIDT